MSKKVLVSPGFGAGWSSWAGESEAQEIAEYAPIIDFIEAGGNPADLNDDHPLIVRMMKDLGLDYFYTGGVEQLQVQTVTGRYRIDEYDGSEYIVTEDSLWR